MISVFICTYNRGSLIDGTLRAIITGQTRLPDEIVVVNGGGANDCSPVLDKWKAVFPALREIKTKNVNLANSRNVGLPQCRGDIIIQTDDDAEPFPDWIERLAQEHERHPEAGVIGGDVVDASGHGLLFKIADATTFPHVKAVSHVRSVPGVNSSYKRAVIEQVGQYDVEMFRGEDVDYNWRAIKAGWEVLSFPDIKVYHHHRATWRGLFNQHFMYGRAYLLVRRKWTDMYCAYPRQMRSLRDVLKGIYFLLVPFLDSAKKLKYVKGFFSKIIAYPIMLAIGYNWHRGVLVQRRIESRKSRKRWTYIFTNTYKPDVGGVQTVTSQVAEAIVSRGGRCQVVTKLSRANAKMSEKIAGVPVARFPFAVGGGKLVASVAQGVSTLLTACLFMTRRPGTVYVHFPEGLTSTVAALSRLFKLRIVTCFHGHDVLRYEEGASTASAVYKAQTRLIARSAAVTACSDYLMAKVAATFHPTCPMYTVYNGVDLSRFMADTPAERQEVRYLFAWGRLEKIKGYDLLIDAFARIASRYADIRLIVAGDGSQRDELLAMAERLGIGGRVKLIGRLSPEDVVRYAKGSVANVIPSLRESFGIVALEAIAAGRPIVYTSGGGLSEVMDPKYGIMVDASAGGISGGLDAVLSGGYVCDFSDASAYLQRFTVERMVDAYLSLP